MSKPISKWNQLIEPISISPLTFLSYVQQTIEEHQLNFIKIGAIYHGKGRSGRRVYLRVYHRRHYIDIGAAPYGKGFYVSLWLFERDTVGKFIQENSANLFLELGKKMRKLPYTGWFAAWGAKQLAETISPPQKDVYHQDEVSMFYSTVHQVVMEVIKGIIGTQGMRDFPD